MPTGGVQAGAIPITYVPPRNTILLALSLAWAEVLDAPKEWLEYHAGHYGAFARDPNSNNVEAVRHDRGKYLPGGKPPWYFPVRKVLSRRAS